MPKWILAYARMTAVFEPLSTDLPCNQLGELLCPERAAEVARAGLGLLKRAVDRCVDRFRRLVELRPAVPLREPFEQHRGREDQRGRIRDAFAGDVGRGAVLSLSAARFVSGHR